MWWLFFSRAPWLERVGALVLMPVAVFATKPIVHPSIANAGMGKLLPIFSIPVLSLALVAWAAASRGLSSGARRASMVGAILLGCGVFALVRTGGITGGGRLDWHWRWTPTPEERLLAQAADAARGARAHSGGTCRRGSREADHGPGRASAPAAPTAGSGRGDDVP